MKLVQKVIALIVMSWVVVSNAQTCNDSITPTTPDSRFSDNGDGTVTDKKTNLIWMRCSLGQTWDGSTCTSSAATYTWQQALQAAANTTFGGSNAWQLPNIKQLSSIVEESCDGPAINLYAFPATLSDYFWTSSPYASDNDNAWYVYFDYGYDNRNVKNSYHYVRLVRPDSN